MNKDNWKIQTILPVLDIVAVILSIISIGITILIAAGLLKIHQHLDEKDIDDIKDDDNTIIFNRRYIKNQEEIIKLLKEMNDNKLL